MAENGEMGLRVLEVQSKPVDVLTKVGQILAQTTTRLEESSMFKQLPNGQQRSDVGAETVTGEVLKMFDSQPQPLDLNKLEKTASQDPKLQSIFRRLVDNFNSVINETAQRTGKKREELLSNPKTFFSALKLDKRAQLFAGAAAITAPFLISDLLHKSSQSNSQETLVATILLGAMIGRVQSTPPPSDELPEQGRIVNPPSKPVRKSNLPSISLPSRKDVKKGIKSKIIPAAVVVGIIASCGILGYINYERGIAQQEEEANAPAPTAVPYEQRQINRAKTTYEYYQKNPDTYDPTTLTPVIQEQLIPYSWDWWYIKDPNQLSKAFQGKVDRSDIDSLVTNPDYFFTILDKMKAKATASGNKQETDRIQKLIDLYKKREEFKGTPEQFLGNSGSYIVPNTKEEQALAAIRRLESIGEKPYGRTGLSKKEVLRRQSYKV